MARKPDDQPDDEAVRLNVFLDPKLIDALGEHWGITSRSAIVRRAVMECAEIQNHLEKGYRMIEENPAEPGAKKLLATKTRFL